MILGSVKAGDIVFCDRRGRRFYAIVLARRERVLEVEPLDRRVTYHTVKAREVLGIWHKSVRNGRASPAGSESQSLTQAPERRQALEHVGFNRG
jgi:hypothetical protein